jgi:energy-coupling factor transporter ATP-binding protein EcfA2
VLRGLTATIVVASHDLAFVTALCSRAIVVDHGGVVADGPVVTILGDHDLLMRHGLA